MAQLLAGTICEGLELRPKIMQNVVAEKWTEDRGDKARDWRVCRHARVDELYEEGGVASGGLEH